MTAQAPKEPAPCKTQAECPHPDLCEVKGQCERAAAAVQAPAPAACAGQWIPVTERMPEMSEARPNDPTRPPPRRVGVLVATDEGRVFETIYSGLGWANLNHCRVTHWMPLPASPGAAPTADTDALQRLDEMEWEAALAACEKPDTNTVHVASGASSEASTERDAARSPQDFAIEHAEYMAVGAEQLIEAANALAYAHNVEEAALIETCAAAETEARCTLRTLIYEFRKRRDASIQTNDSLSGAQKQNGMTPESAPSQEWRQFLRTSQAAESGAAPAQEPVAIYHGGCTIDCGEHGHHNLELLKMIPAGTKLYAAPPADALRESHAQLVEALEVAKNGLEWYRDAMPEADSGADDEAMQQIDAALTRAQEIVK